MDVRCPKCRTLYEFNERRISGSSVSLKCSQCSHVFRVENPHGDKSAEPRRWMIRKADTGDILYFGGMSVLQKWIIDRKVARTDEISKTGKTWKKLATIGELASFFQVAESIERLQGGDPRQMPPLADDRSAVPSDDEATMPVPRMKPVDERAPLLAEPQPEHLDASAPGRPFGNASAADNQATWQDAAPVAPELATGPWEMSGNAAPSSTQRSEAKTTNARPPKQPVPTPVMGQRERQLPAGTFDDPLELPHRRRSSGGGVMLPLIVVVVVALGLGAAAYVYFVQPELLASLGIEVAGAKPAADKDEPLTEAVVDDEDSGESALDEVADATAAADTSSDDASTNETDTAVVKADVPRDKPEKADKANNTAAKDDGAMTGSYDGLMNRGYRNLRGGRASLALKAFSAAAAQRPTSSEAASGMGWAYLGMGNTGSAVGAFKKSLKINPRYGDAKIGLGQAYRNAGNKPAALKAYEDYLQYYPNGPKASIARHHAERLRREIAAASPPTVITPDAGNTPAPAADAGGGAPAPTPNNTPPPTSPTSSPGGSP